MSKPDPYPDEGDADRENLMRLVQVGRRVLVAVDEGRIHICTDDMLFYNPGWVRQMLNDLESALKPFPTDL